MKTLPFLTLSGILGFILAVTVGATNFSEPASVTLLWEYPVEDVTPDLQFKLYHKSDLSSPWEVLQTVPGAERSYTFQILPGAHFFVATTVNFWGESEFSNDASTPRTPGSVYNLQIRKTP